jgi:hypothetical protein
MVYRCTSPKSPNYGYYGARGIAVCERWLKFENFYADMGERPAGTSIDRINSDRNYEPGNCRWATRREQQQNSRNAKLTQADIAWIRSRPGMSIRQTARALGVSHPTVLKWATP